MEAYIQYSCVQTVWNVVNFVSLCKIYLEKFLQCCCWLHRGQNSMQNCTTFWTVMQHTTTSLNVPQHNVMLYKSIQYSHHSCIYYQWGKPLCMWRGSVYTITLTAAAKGLKTTVFPEEIFPWYFLIIPWQKTNSLTFSWQPQNSITFPGFPEKWSPCP